MANVNSSRKFGCSYRHLNRLFQATGEKNPMDQYALLMDFFDRGLFINDVVMVKALEKELRVFTGSSCGKEEAKSADVAIDKFLGRLLTPQNTSLVNYELLRDFVLTVYVNVKRSQLYVNTLSMLADARRTGASIPIPDFDEPVEVLQEQVSVCMAASLITPSIRVRMLELANIRPDLLHGVLNRFIDTWTAELPQSQHERFLDTIMRQAIKEHPQHPEGLPLFDDKQSVASYIPREDLLVLWHLTEFKPLDVQLRAKVAHLINDPTLRRAMMFS